VTLLLFVIAIAAWAVPRGDGRHGWMEMAMSDFATARRTSERGPVMMAR
jgi:hypothetical protein